MLIAIVSPLLIELRRKFKQDFAFLGLLAIIYWGYELLLWISKTIPKPEIDNLLVDLLVNNLFFFIFLFNILFYILPYGCVFCLGLVLEKLNSIKVFCLGIFFLAIFGILAYYYYSLNGEFIPTQAYKVLPRLYYISYGLSISLFLYLLVGKIESFLVNSHQRNSFFSESIIFISSSTLWIFLWHLVGLQYIDIWSMIFPKASHYLIRYIIVLLSSIFLTWLHKIAVRQIDRKSVV